MIESESILKKFSIIGDPISIKLGFTVPQVIVLQIHSYLVHKRQTMKATRQRQQQACQ